MENLIDKLKESMDDIDTLIFVLEGKCGNGRACDVVRRYSHIPTDISATLEKIKRVYGENKVPIIQK